MATGEDWSELEVEACVADYLHMLTLELNGQPRLFALPGKIVNHCELVAISYLAHLNA